jgi:hypothetical protein
MKKRTAAVIAILLPCVAYVAVVLLTDRIFRDTRVPAGREHRAAFAIRDNVTPFQKWGSRQFTWPYLSAAYDAAWYLTQTNSDGSKEAFLERLEEALERYREVDLYLLAHHNHYVDWVAQVPAAARSHLRLVYNTGCWDLRQGPRWLNLGARAYIGHPGKCASPVFYLFFLRRWTRGHTLDEAINEANQLMRSELNRAEVFSLGKMRASKVFQESAAAGFGRLQLRLDGSEGGP